jgi:uncharacterized membrane protein
MSQPTPEPKGLLNAIKRFFKVNLIAGILFLVPLMATFMTLRVIVRWMDKSLLLLPPAYRPEAFLSFKVPGLGAILVVVIVLATGILVRNLLGRRLVLLWDAIVDRIPFVSNFYKAVKQLVETIFYGPARDFKRVVLIEYPRTGLYTLAFVTGVAVGEIQQKTVKKVLNVFVATTPNPTSGFYLMVPEEDIIPLEMSVEDAFKVLMSGGILNPDATAGKKKSQATTNAETAQEDSPQ